MAANPNAIILPSQLSPTPVGNAPNRDARLLPPTATRNFKPNNSRLNLDTNVEHPVIIEILKRHPLRAAFTIDRQVPAFYLRQLWHSLTFHADAANPHFTIQVDDYVSILTPDRLRQVLQLPTATADHPFEEPVPVDVLCTDILALGYNDELPSTGKFKRMHLPQLWFTLFTFVNRCLTSKHTGYDKASIAVLRMFHGIVYNRHYDYAMLIWTDLIELVEDKGNNRNRQFVPFQRFFQLIVHAMLNSNPLIPRRTGTPLGPSSALRFIKLNDLQFNYVMPIPEPLLAFADQTAPSVISYRESIGLMVQPPPVVPTQEPPREEHQVRGEGPSLGERIQDHGDPELGRENVVGGASDQPNLTTVSTTQSIPPQPRRRRIKMTVPRSRVHPTGPLDSDHSEDEQPLRRRRRTTNAETEAIRRIGTQPPLQESSTETIPEVSAPRSTTSAASIPIPSEAEPSEPFDFEHSPVQESLSDFFTEPFTGEIRRAEGETVENENVSECLGRSKVIASEIPTTTSQVTETASSSHSLGISSSQDAAYLTAHLHTPPSHSVASQKTTVSQLLVSLAPYLVTLQSGGTTIETRGSSSPASTSIVCTSSLEPPREHASIITASLRGPVGTPVVMPMPGIPRGSGGNPTSANIIPTLSVGHTVPSTVVSTGNLSDPGVSLSGTPSFSIDVATQAFVEQRHKAALDALDAHEQTLRAFGRELIQGILSAVRTPMSNPNTASSSRPSSSRPSTSRSPPPPPRQSSSDDSDSIFRDPRSQRSQFNRNELMSMLYADLLAESNERGLPEEDLVGLLRRNLTIPTVTHHEFDVFRTAMVQRMDDLEKKQQDKADEILGAITALRTEIQESCRPAVSVPRRRHDQDDPDFASNRPEGEIGRSNRTPSTQSAQPSSAPTSSARRSSRKRQRLSEAQQVDTPTVEKPADDINLESTHVEVEPQSSNEEVVNVQRLRDSVKDWFQDVYEPVLKEIDYVNLMHTEKNYTSGSENRPALLPHQISWERILTGSKSRWINQQIRTPYLEETMSKIFVKQKKDEDLSRIHLITEMNSSQVTEYVSMLKMKAKNPEEVISRHRIVNIMQIGSDKVLRVLFPTFKVRRADGRVYEFTEADFARIDVSDMEILYLELKEKTKRNEEEQLALRAIIRHVQKELRFSYLHDFQRGIESQQRKVHLLKPNQAFPNLQNLKVLTLISKPVHGMVYILSTGEKRFLRFEELPAYSDGTLWAIRNRIAAEISTDRKSSDRMPHKKRENLLDAIERIDNRIIYRQTLRRFEGIFEQRR